MTGCANCGAELDPGEGVPVGGVTFCRDCFGAEPSGGDGCLESDRRPVFGEYADADFTTADPETFPDELAERERWMGAGGSTGKQPFAPWGDRDHPDADPDEDARWKWGLTENYTTLDEATEWLQSDPRVEGRTFMLTADGPYAFVDGDDVRDPETGEVHPAFVGLLENLGLTYADISTSGGGVHAYYRGELPEGVKEAAFEIDSEPWGENDDPPTVEIYSLKHVCVATGKHVPGTPTEVAVWDSDALETILDAAGETVKDEPDASQEAFKQFDTDDYEPNATGSDESTDDIRDLFAAIDRLDAQRVAAKTIVSAWNDQASTSEGERAFWPTWGDSSDSGTANIVNSDRWQDTGDRGGYGGPVCMAAIDADEIDINDTDCPREVNGATWFEAVDHLRDIGFSIPEYESGGHDTEDYHPDPRDVDVVVDPERAWDAAGRVGPDDLPDGGALPTDDGDAFTCPACGEHVDVVRAAALERGLVDDCGDDLGTAYAEAYRVAREEYDAPLPRYLTTADSVAEFDAVLGAVAEVGYFHLDNDAVESNVTGCGGDVGGEAVRTLDPAWRDSESGESVLVFPSGTVWDADTETTVDALRFVALEHGLIDEPGDALQGAAFTDAYQLAREEYGAPLPRWAAARDGERSVTPMLPPAEDLVDDPDAVAVAADELNVVREDVEDLLGDIVEEADQPIVLTSPPATGKTTAAVKNARDCPMTYLAPRKELQQQALAKADEWGVSTQVLPVFADTRLAKETRAEAVEHVRERGKDRLRDVWAIHAAVDGPVFPEDADDDADSADLDRPTCSTADGEHGEAWALAFHVARELGYTPRDIHERATALFGGPAPCQQDGDCPYSLGWDAVSDPEDPADLLVGSYVHANVESARTYYQQQDRQVDRSPRVLVLDEFPGDAYEVEFGKEADDHATWLAAALCEDVEDRRDVYQGNLWDDEWLRAWLDGRAADDIDAVARTVAALQRRRDLVKAREAARRILDEVETGLLESLSLADPLREVADGGRPETTVGDLEAATEHARPEYGGYGVVEWVDSAVLEPLAAAQGDRSVDTDRLPGGGELHGLVERAVAASDNGEDGAATLCEAATDALRGGDAGTRELAVWADDGYAHPDAHHLLKAVVMPAESDRVDVVETSGFAFDPDATDGTRLNRVLTCEKTTALSDRNGHGAILHSPPPRTAGGGDDVPVVGLDATGRERLWSLVLGEDVESADIFNSPQGRAEFLRDVLGLKVVRCSDRMRPYEGDPHGKDLDGDVALIQGVNEEYAGVQAPRERGGEPQEIGAPAVITTKGVRNVLEDDDRLGGVVSAWENFGNLTGANDLGEHQLATILGSPHYGDRAVERMAALAGEEVDTSRASGRGAALDYDSAVANTYLKHMREDQVMQAALRFARGGSGATVFVRTAALRDDLPVLGEGQVVESYSDTATAVARAWRRLGGSFTVADVADAADVTKRHVRRVLAEFVDAGYLTREEGGPGRANRFTPEGEPGAGEVELPGDVGPDPTEAGQPVSNEYYTWNVRVHGVGDARPPLSTPSPGRLPAPETAPERATAGDPPPESD